MEAFDDVKVDEDSIRLDNPAGRLAQFLRDLKRVGPSVTGSAPNVAWVALGVVLGTIDSGEDLEPSASVGPEIAKTLTRMGHVMDLPNQIELAVKRKPEVSDRLIALLPDVRQFLQMMMNNMQSNLQLPQDNLVTTVEIISEQLSRYAPEVLPSDDVLLKMREEIDDLLRSVVAADINPDLAQFIAEHLHALLEAIDTYKISGAIAIRRAINEAVGDIYVRASEGAFVKTAEDDRAKTFGKRFVDLLNKLSALINIPAAAITIGNAAAALGGGGPPRLH